MEKLRVGVVGDGQLAGMLKPAADLEGVQLVVLGFSPNGPAGRLHGVEHIYTDSLYNPDGIRALGDKVDFITAEIEHFNVDALAEQEAKGRIVRPGTTVFRIIQDKFLQKSFFKDNSIPVPRFTEVRDRDDLYDVFDRLQTGRVIVKSRKGGYDGRGNKELVEGGDVTPVWEHFKEAPVYAEAFFPFEKELAIIGARDVHGTQRAYELTKTNHDRHICESTITPAPVGASVRQEATVIADRVLASLADVGAYGIEMFVNKNGRVVLNEVAPRVHNSGHWTIEGAVTSQFRQHLRAVLGRSLESVDMTAPVAHMKNYLGTATRPARHVGGDRIWALGGIDAYIHIYGKADERPDRKMGHWTVLADSYEKAIADMAVVSKDYL